MPSLCDFENAVKDISIRFEEDEENYTLLTSDYSKLCTLFKQHGMEFSVRDSRSARVKGDDSFCKKKIMWSSKTVKFCGMPFIMNKVCYLQCANGPNYYENSSNNPIENDHPGKQKRFRLQPTKKMNCPATKKVVHLKYYSQYKVKGMRNMHELKAKAMKSLRMALDSGNVESEDRYLIIVSKASSHSHAVWTTFLTQSLDSTLKTRIKTYVVDGITHIQTIQTLLKNHVRDEISGNISSSCRSYFPNTKTIYNNELKYVYEKRGSRIDQEAIENNIRSWKSQGGNIFCRVYSQEKAESFLFCYQNEWQQKLLKWYGGIVLLDSTYRTTKYSLPLFSLVVKTNINYIVVGIFLVQWETSDAISEALNIFKTWNGTWDPKYFLVDFCEVEINAITRCFNCPVYLCDFHREQAWVRWFKASKNISDKDDSQMLLSSFRKLAGCKTNEEFLTLAAIVYESEAWKRNPKVQKYFLNTWLPVKEKWTSAFFEAEYVLIINTNNGIESQHHVLKHKYLKQHSDKSLCGVLQIIINRFLNDSFKSYQINNSRLSRQYNKYNEEIPVVLLERPTFFIRHVYQRFKTAESIYTRNSIAVLSNDEKAVYLVQSETIPDLKHSVDFSTPSCTCHDFFKYRFPCKHMCAIILYVPNVSFHSLPSSYLNSPYISLDPNYSLFETPFWTDDNETEGETAIPFSSSDVHCNDAPTSFALPIETDQDLYSKQLSEIKELAKNILDNSYLLPTGGSGDLTCIIKELKSVDSNMKRHLKNENGVIVIPNKKAKRK